MEGVHKVMEEVKAAMNEHVDLVSDLLQRISSELRSGFAPAVDNLVGFFHAIDWKVPLALLFPLVLVSETMCVKSDQIKLKHNKLLF